jgi:hypothetical protein
VRIGCTQRLRQQQKGLAKDGTRCHYMQSENEADPSSAQPGSEKGRK